MRLKLTILPALVIAALALVGSVSATAPKSATLVIRHQVQGCHAWSLNGGPYVAHQVVRLARGGSLEVTNNDLMAQELVKASGPRVRMDLVRHSHMGDMPMGMTMGKPGSYTMAHMGAKLRVTFTRARTYRFELLDRGDYVEVKTRGADKELRLEVVVP